MALSDRIKARREEMRITATELARRAQVSKGFISEIESGQAPRPSGNVLYRLATALGTTVADLLEQEVRPVSRKIPVTLQQFAAEANLPVEDVKMLAQIRFRGEQPSTVEDWQYLYQSIRRSVIKGS